jgi:hypothetical protein
MPVGRARALAAALLLAVGQAVLAQGELPAAPRGELGVRWWASSGETKLSHNAQVLNPVFGNPTSVLVYGNLDANTFELFGRVFFAERWFLKGTLGVGDINRGSFDDEDFAAGQVKFSDTNSSIPQGRIGYGTIDFGRHWRLREGAVSLGVFGGFGQWTEEYEAYGATDFTGPDIPHSVNVISNKVRWNALRVGVTGDFALGRARLSLDLALVPYAKMRNEDSHHLRGDLGPVPNIIDEGDAWGVQADAELRYPIFRRTELAVGLRFWRLEVRDGTTDFANFNFAEEAPLVDFYTQRTGITLSLRQTW